MELTNEFVANGVAQDLLSRMCDMRFDENTSYDILRIKYCCEKELKVIAPQWEELVKKYAHLNEDGSIKPLSGPGTYTIKEEHLEQWNKEKNEFMAKTFKVPRVDKLSREFLGASKDFLVSPKELMQLNPILEDFSLE